MTFSAHLKRLLFLSAAAGLVLLLFSIGSAPVDSDLTDSAPVNSAPSDSVSNNSAPVNSAPVNSMTSDSTPDNSAPTDSAPVGSAGNIDAYVNALAQRIDPKVAGAINGIDGTPRRLLALRGYLRSRAVLKTKWTWNDDEIASYKQTAEYRAALAEIDKVKAKFAEQNPGFSIEVNTEIRTLEAQIASWNSTKSVATAAESLFAAVQNELAKPVYREQPAAGLELFETFLQNQGVSVAPTVATPGLSQHGQLRAFDFRILQGGRVVATTDSSTVNSVWDAQGWTQKLNAAITAASQKFSGPLAAPREPWHYTYVP